MKISKEVRIGLLVAVAILIFFIGFNFLKNTNLFSNTKDYYCFYTNVDGLQNSANVQVRGLNVGHVSGMELIDSKGVKVTITVGKNIELPVGTIASLESVDLLGAKAIRLDLGAGPGMLQNGAELIANKPGGLVDNVSAELTPRLRELKGTISAIDTALGGVNELIGDQNQKEIAEALHAINNSAKNIDELTATLNKESAEITAILQNVRSITGNLASQKDTINQVLANANKITRQLGNAPLEKTINELHTTISAMKEVMEKINKGEGSAGKLVNDKELYKNLNSSLKSLDSLMSDIKAHPSRYINVTIFGSSKKKN